jgi:2'-5' RNA ligase
VPRTFVAVLLPDNLRNKAFEFGTSLRRELGDADGKLVKWVDRDNLHVTIKFLGEVTEERLGDVFDRVEAAARQLAPFDLEIGGAGAFPSKRRPSVLWIGSVGGSDALAELASLVEDSLEEIGFAREHKAFHGHVTLGRLRKGSKPLPLAEALAAAELGILGSSRVDSISVMKSELRPGGPIYSVLRRADLTEK